MHHSIQLELARQHQAELMREADRFRLARVAGNGERMRRRPWALGQLTWRDRAQQRPATAV